MRKQPLSRQSGQTTSHFLIIAAIIVVILTVFANKVKDRVPGVIDQALAVPDVVASIEAGM